MKKFAAVLSIFAAALLFLCPSADAALTLKAESLVFNGAQEDLRGAGTAVTPDGKQDAVFTLYLTGAQAIRDITLKNETTGVTWSASSQSNFLAVKSSGGELVNASGRMPITPVLLAGQFTLILNDAANAIPKDSKFTATAILIDGATTSASTTAAAEKKAPAPGEKKPEEAKPTGTTPAGGAAKDEIVLFESRSESDLDLAGSGEAVGANAHRDFRFDAVIRLTKGMQARGVKITAENGGDRAQWDTVPDNGTPLVVLVDPAKTIINKSDGSVVFTDEVRCAMLVDDKTGILSRQGTKARLTITLSDGKMMEKEATAGKRIVAQNSVAAEFRGIGSYDFVGQNKKLQSNMNPDSFVKATVNAKGRITGIRVTNTKNGASWDTAPGSGSPLAAIIAQDGKKLNNSDGSVAFDIDGTEEFNVAFDEAKDVGTGPYKITIVFSDGRLLEGLTAGKAAAEPATTAAPAERALLFVSAKPESVPVDLVGKNKNCKPDGTKDMSLIVRATVKDVIRALVLTDGSGKGWDTIPSNNGRWLIGVRDGGKLLNSAKNGSVRIETTPGKEYQLLVQNNGKLNLGYGKLLLSVTWGDGSVTETTLKW